MLMMTPLTRRSSSSSPPRILTFAHLCIQLTYADVCGRMRTTRRSSSSSPARMLTYADVCGRMLTYGWVCREERDLVAYELRELHAQSHVWKQARGRPRPTYQVLT